MVMETVGSRSIRRVILLLVVLVAFTLRLFRLADASMWWDEGWSVWLARQSLLDIARVSAADVHPPLYYWLLRLWMAFAGEGEFAVRLLSAVLGTLTVVATWYVGRLLLPRRPWVALAAALLLSTSRLAIWWSQETRMYVLGGLLVTLSLAFSVRLRWQRSWTVAWAYWLVTVAALWNLYLLAFLLVIEGLYWLWTLRGPAAKPERVRLAVQWAAMQVAVLAAWAPWVAYALPRTRSSSVQTAFDAPLYLQLYATLLSVGASVNVADYWVPTLLVVAVVGLGLLAMGLQHRASRGARPGDALLLVLALVVPPGAVWLVTMLPRSLGYLPKPEARYLLPFAGTFSLLAAWAVAALADWAGRLRRWVGGGLLAALVLLSLWSLQGYYGGRYWSDDYRSLAQTLQAHHRSEDVVVLHNDQAWPVFAYHWAGPFEGVPNRWEIDPPTAQRFLAPLWQEHAAVWLVVNEDALPIDPQRLLEQWLAERAAARHEWRFGSKRLLAFARTAARAESLLSLGPGFVPTPPPRPLADGGLTLVGWEQPLRRARAGEVAYLAAYVDRQGGGGQLEVRLGDPALATAEAVIPAGQGMLRVPLAVQIPAGAPGQAVQWRLRLGAAEAVEGELRLMAVPVAVAAAVEPQYAVSFTYGDPVLIRLLGYDLSGSAMQGSSVQLTLYWQAEGTPSLSYKVFTHLVNPQGQVGPQRDDYPVQGNRPTTAWTLGEIVLDRYEIRIEPNVPTGTYTLKVGFYDASTGNRLGPVRDATGTAQPNDQAVLGTVDVLGQ